MAGCRVYAFIADTLCPIRRRKRRWPVENNAASSSVAASRHGGPLLSRVEWRGETWAAAVQCTATSWFTRARHRRTDNCLNQVSSGNLQFAFILSFPPEQHCLLLLSMLRLLGPMQIPRGLTVLSCKWLNHSRHHKFSSVHYIYIPQLSGMLHCTTEPPSNSIWPHLSYGLVRSKREYCHNCSLVVVLCSFL